MSTLLADFFGAPAAPCRRAGVLVALLVLSAPAFGVGEVVTDPGAYSHMVEQIRATNTMITDIRTQIETLGGIKTAISDIKYSAEGVYGRGAGILDNIQGIAKNVQETSTSLKKAGDFSEFNADKFNKKASPYRDVRLDPIFQDPRSRNYDFWKNKDKRYNARQQIYKDNLSRAEDVLEAMPKRVKYLGELSEQIDKTKGLKDAADLQNRLLAEILLAQHEAIKLLSHIAQAMAASHYEGIDPDVAQKAEAEAAKPQPSRNFVYERAESKGLVGISDEERRRRTIENVRSGSLK